MKILGISGSLRQHSFNTASLRAAQSLLPDGVEMELADLSGIPMYDQDLRDQDVPESVIRLATQVHEADALLFATPEYNYSISGALKNAIDWISRQSPNPFNDKPAAIMSASMSMLGGVRAQYHLRQIMVFQNIHCLNKPEVMIASAHQRFDESGNLTDDATCEHIEGLVKALVEWTGRIHK